VREPANHARPFFISAEIVPIAAPGASGDTPPQTPFSRISVKPRFSTTVFYLAVLLGAGCARSIPAPKLIEPGPTTPLKNAVGERDIRLGVAVDAQALRTDPQYRELIRYHFNSLTPENAMKLSELCSVRGRCRTDALDELVQFALDNQMAVRGHPLVWFRQVPPWVDDLSSAEVERLMNSHIAQLMARYAEQISDWDVVNEAVLSTGLFRPSVWLTKLGAMHIALAYRAATENMNRGKLFYNDFDLETNPRKLDAALWMLAALREYGLQIDGVGFQMHIRPASTPTAEQLRAVFGKVAKAGFEIQVTELDVALALPASRRSLAEQAVMFCEVARACREQAACSSITVWGLSDRHSWIPQAIPGHGAATMFDEELLPKPSFYGLQRGLAGEACEQKHFE
jgi:endo-1,4-beta-xylanase